MNSKLLIIKHSDTVNYSTFIEEILENEDYDIYNDMCQLKNKRILFLIHLDELGYDIPFLLWLKGLPDHAFVGSVAGMIVTSTSEYYTKSFAQDIILHCNRKGLAFIGHSVLEIVAGYENFKTWQKTMSLDLITIANRQGKQLIERLMAHQFNEKKRILALHASSRKTSNTLGLWHLVKPYLISDVIDEIHIENGTVVDCKGCPFQTCIHFGKYHSCFYGGIMVEEVLPAIETADVIVWICPNYNDAISANMMAVINRLTVLYRQMTFHDKACYAVVVSGNSGSDSVAKQLIGALNINKGFQLPPYFTIMATANDPLKVLELEGIENKVNCFSSHINKFCLNTIDD